MLRIIGTPSAGEPPSGQLAFLVQYSLHADRRQHDRRAEPETEDVDPEIAPRHIAEKARNDKPVAECLAICAHGLFGSGRAGHVIESLRLQDRFGLELELIDRDGLRGDVTGESCLVDLHLASQAP